MKTLAEIRDELAESGSQNGPYQPYCSNSFKTGFDAGAKAIMEHAQKLVDYLKDHGCHVGSSYFDGEDKVVTNCLACNAIKEWQEFVGEMKK